MIVIILDSFLAHHAFALCAWHTHTIGCCPWHEWAVDTWKEKPAVFACSWIVYCQGYVHIKVHKDVCKWLLAVIELKDMKSRPRRGTRPAKKPEWLLLVVAMTTSCMEWEGIALSVKLDATTAALSKTFSSLRLLKLLASTSLSLLASSGRTWDRAASASPIYPSVPSTWLCIDLSWYGWDMTVITSSVLEWFTYLIWIED